MGFCMLDLIIIRNIIMDSVCPSGQPLRPDLTLHCVDVLKSLACALVIFYVNSNTNVGVGSNTRDA